MCVGGGDIPTMPERQAGKLPEGDARSRSKDDERRRRGMMSTILTSAAGTSSPLSTTAGGKSILGV